MPIAKNIEQEMTKKLLYSPVGFSALMPEACTTTISRTWLPLRMTNLWRGIMTGNEVRDWLGLPPLNGLDELVILENYIPRGMIGNQNKLNVGEIE